MKQTLKAKLFRLLICYPFLPFPVLLWGGRFNDQLLHLQFPHHSVKKSVEKSNDEEI